MIPVEQTFADPLAALVAFLARDGAVAELVGERVFGDELPNAEAANMPRKVLVLRHAGSSVIVEAESYAEIGSYRIDVWAYGETPYEASRLRGAAYLALKNLPRKALLNTLIHSAVREGGPLSIREPDTHWPLKVETWRVLAADYTFPEQ